MILSLLGPGELFGEFEAFTTPGLTLHEFSLICRSSKGEILSMERNEFAKKLSVIPQSLNLIVD
jgi:CRP-like cAMP-binding protein